MLLGFVLQHLAVQSLRTRGQEDLRSLLKPPLFLAILLNLANTWLLPLVAKPRESKNNTW